MESLSASPASEISLALTTPEGLVQLRTALNPKDQDYDKLLTAFRGLSLDERQGIHSACQLVEIEDLARKELAAIRQTLDTSIKAFDLQPHHEKLLRDPHSGRNGTEVTPDMYFFKYADTTSRIILRLISKHALPQIKRLAVTKQAVEKPSTPGQNETPGQDQRSGEGEERSPLLDKLIERFQSIPVHHQITDYAQRWDQNSGLLTKAERKRSRKETDENAAYKRQVTESLKQ
ncbi:uncharacterized protein K444DRAFT_670149 [Hyaloscypha bicolor E]|uniref:Uncharacterized protein n=1 Tax=Hyaloscypha bicolor E TaxID=1095630 RepID=A0A2J6SI30_9HELO|nr:uncharacterized protein K444DRAFT_670149 [Hyaloscypha bicolor E]PMD50424.1 hypothetical protein K444DRAFT_670149 [Hyaloscypha bicolor E]